MPNRLGNAASPYLRSHADNPVDWWPWGPEPFAEAKRRDVPVMVSIGYSTCHWCHVMARESFSDPEVAAYLNENAVAIKVDREENAEVDSSYLAAAGAFTQNLGWPLTVFVTPEGRAFFAGTYYPPKPVQGHPSFRQVLDAVFDAWRNRREEVERNGAEILAALAHGNTDSGDLLTDFAPVLASLAALEDTTHGGFGGAPKFPISPVLRFLVERGDPLGLRTLDAMAASPLRDRVDGGFFRYATQADWSEPHYERMLYDNAQLLAVYALAGRDDAAEGIANFLLTTLQQPSGGFASAQDSESMVDGQRVEGFYYSLDAASRARLEAPPIDGKILTGWNGLAIEGLALAGRLLDRSEWIAAARRAADFLLAEHVLADRVVRSSIDGTLSPAPATLEDYGMLARGLLELALTTGESTYARAARDLVDATLTEDFFAVPGGGDPVLAGQGILVEPDNSDGAHPSGLAAVAGAALLLQRLTARDEYRDAAVAAASRVAEGAARHPVSYGAALTLMNQLATPATQLVVVGKDAELERLAHQQRAGVVAAVTQEQARAWAASGFELFEGRVARVAATAYLCADFVCHLPVDSAAELEQLLSR